MALVVSGKHYNRSIKNFVTVGASSLLHLLHELIFAVQAVISRDKAASRTRFVTCYTPPQPRPTWAQPSCWLKKQKSANHNQHVRTCVLVLRKAKKSKKDML